VGICLARYGLGAYRQTLSPLMIAHQLSADPSSLRPSLCLDVISIAK